MKAGNHSIQITFDFWVFNFFVCWLGKFNEFLDQSDFTFRQASFWNYRWFRFKLVQVALKVFEKKIKKAQELEAEEARRRLESSNFKEKAHWMSQNDLTEN